MPPAKFEPTPDTLRPLIHRPRPPAKLVRYEVEFCSLTVSLLINTKGHVTIHA